MTVIRNVTVSPTAAARPDGVCTTLATVKPGSGRTAVLLVGGSYRSNTFEPSMVVYWVTVAVLVIAPRAVPRMRPENRNTTDSPTSMEFVGWA